MEKSLNLDLVQEKCAECGFSQSSLAEKIGVTRAAVSKWFTEKSFPRPAELLKLGRLLGLRHSDLVKSELMVEEPLVAFRKRGASKTTLAHVERAKDMGNLLRPLVPYLDFDPFFSPPSLKNPTTEYRYIQDLVVQIRRDIGVGEDCPIQFQDLIGTFHKYQAVIIPTLWGEKSKHENALHIHLPDSKTTWIYLNLDVQMHDFKFWMAHELGHVLTVDLLENERLEDAENFADTFAGALLFPERVAGRTFHTYSKRRSARGRIQLLCEVAKEYRISPLSVYYELKHFAENADQSFEEIAEYALHPQIAEFNKMHPLVSEYLFDDETPSADHFMRIAQERFGTDIYKVLGDYIREKEPSPSLVSSLLSVSPMDGRAYYDALAH